MPRRIIPPADSVKYGRKAVHDWELLLNGERWELQRGIDFHCAPSSIQQLFYLRCREAGLEGECVKALSHPDNWEIQAHGA